MHVRSNLSTALSGGVKGVGAKSWAALAMWVGLCLLVGWLGSFATMEGMRSWHPSLVKPAFNPPSWVFAPVWTLLYVLMGVSAWLVGRQPFADERRTALGLFGIQLFFNLSWSVMFFGFRSTALGLANIILLWILIAATIHAFAKLSKPAAGLLIPCLAWVTFASILNFAFWRLNP